MHKLELSILAAKNVLRAGTKSILCIVAVAIGIAAISLTLSISDTANQAIQNEIDQIGIQGIAFYTKSGESFSNTAFDILAETNEITAYMPLVLMTGSATLRNQTVSVGIAGIDDQLQGIFELQVLHGQLPTKAQVANCEPVIVIDEELAEKCYSRSNIVGKSLWLSVSGVFQKMEICAVIRSQSAGITSFLGGNIPFFVYLPYTTLTALSSDISVNKVLVRSESDNIPALSEALVQHLSRQTGAAFASENIDQYVSNFQSITGIVALLATGIAGISIIVGGIGVANTMISSVDARIKEIGIYRALGATRSEIVQTFLLEAIILCVIGGVIGLILNTIIIIVLQIWLQITINSSVTGIILSLMTAISCGVCVGWLPAIRAANLDPIQAIRQE